MHRVCRTNRSASTTSIAYVCIN